MKNKNFEYSSRCLLHDLIHLTRFRQKFIIREIYLHIYPITIENKTDLSIANIRLPPAEDKSYLASICTWIGFRLEVL